MAKRQTTTYPSKNRLSPKTVKSQATEAVQNLLLAALPLADRDRLLPTLEIVSLKLKEVLLTAGGSAPYVYFPGGGFLSIVTILRNGSMVEVATIGREGMIGALVAMGGGPPGSTAVIVQGATDTCYRMTADAFQKEMDRRGGFCDLLTKFSRAFVGFIMQSAACNAAHSIEQRCARWLLTAQDRMGQERFPLTQELLAMMLAANRPTVSVIAGSLQRDGLISYRRGQVTIVDRKRLQATSCECYRITTDMLAAVFSGGGQAKS